MAIVNIPIDNLPYTVVSELPIEGEENHLYGVRIDPEDEFSLITDYRWHNNEWEEVNLNCQIFGFLFNDYQESVAETIAEMEQTITEQASLIQQLEEAVFPVENTSFEMMITSLMQVELDLYDENDEIIPNQGLSVEYWEEPQELVYQNEVKKGIYYLKNSDGYALGKSNGEIQPLICEGGVVNLGNVELIMLV